VGGAVVTIDVKRIRELLAKAEPTPWEAWGSELVATRPGSYVSLASCQHEDDTALIAAAVNAAPQLLAVYEAACRACEVIDSSAGYITQELYDAVEAAPAEQALTDRDLKPANDAHAAIVAPTERLRVVTEETRELKRALAAALDGWATWVDSQHGVSREASDARTQIHALRRLCG
jgi:hypothetical protein